MYRCYVTRIRFILAFFHLQRTSLKHLNIIHNVCKSVNLEKCWKNCDLTCSLTIIKNIFKTSILSYKSFVQRHTMTRENFRQNYIILRLEIRILGYPGICIWWVFAGLNEFITLNFVHWCSSWYVDFIVLKCNLRLIFTCKCYYLQSLLYIDINMHSADCTKKWYA